MQQDVLFFSDGGPDLRWGGNEHARAGFTNWNTITTDTLFAGKSGIFELLNTGSEDGESWVPLEANTSIRPGWFYHADEDSLVKTPEELFNTYLTSVGRGSTLLLNVPPDQRGLIHENDIASLKGFRELLDKRFAEDLVTEAVVEASNVRGNSNQYSAENLIDGDKESYWATDDGVTTASLEFDFREEKEINYLVLQEYIQLGQRVRSFTVDGWMNDEWEEISAATTIGYKRILELDSKKVQKIRINITDSKASPVLSSVQVF
jgi:alpha-L-fucosidase